jgi:hypothetical protein
MTLNPSPGSDNTVSGLAGAFTSAQAQAIGDVCRIDAASKMTLAKADAIANAWGLAIVADASISSGASGNYLFLGMIRHDAWNWTLNTPIYLSATGTTGNTLTQTSPSGANNVIQIVGWPVTADVMMFTPQLVQVEHV